MSFCAFYSVSCEVDCMRQLWLVNIRNSLHVQSCNFYELQFSSNDNDQIIHKTRINNDFSSNNWMISLTFSSNDIFCFRRRLCSSFVLREINCMLHFYDLYKCKIVVEQSNDKIDVFIERFLDQKINCCLVKNNKIEKFDKIVFDVCITYFLTRLRIR